MLDQEAKEGGSQRKKPCVRESKGTDDAAARKESRACDFQTLQRGVRFLKRSHSCAGLFPNAVEEVSPSNVNNNVRDDSDSDDFLSAREQRCRNRRLHFITFLAGSNELHCVFQPSECQPKCCDPLPLRSSCYTGRCSPSPCLSPTERLSKCHLSPAQQYPCSKSSSVEDSVTEWLRCKERSRCKEMNRCKDASERLFGNRKPCKKSDLFPANSTSDLCCKNISKCECVDAEPRIPSSPPYCEPVCFSTPAKPCYCSPHIPCTPTPPCSPSLFRKALDDCCRPACFEPAPCEPSKCDLCCVSQGRMTDKDCPTSSHSWQSCVDTSEQMNVKSYRQFRKDYVRKWGIKISNSDGGEWVYKDSDNIFPIYRRKSGKITRISLANGQDKCGCPKQCDDVPPCNTSRCTPSKRQRRGSLCCKADVCCDNSFKEVCKPKVTCFRERGCQRIGSATCSKAPRTCTTGPDCPCASCPGVHGATCLKSAGFQNQPNCPSPPGCLKEISVQKLPSQMQLKKISPCQSPAVSFPFVPDNAKFPSPQQRQLPCNAFGGV